MLTGSAARLPRAGPGSLEEGDTVTWTANNGTRSWGLVDYVTAEGVHVWVGARTAWRKSRYLIAWDKVTGHYRGRAEHDKHM